MHRLLTGGLEKERICLAKDFRMPEDNTIGPYADLEQRLGYVFKDRNLLVRALTSPSFRTDRPDADGLDNQRLEFLGDAVFGLLTAQFMYERYADEDEGALTVRRSHLASGRGLADLARRAGLGAYLRLGRADEAAGGRDKSRSLTDAMEAVFGAAWCDGGLSAAEAIFNALDVGADDQPIDAKTENPKGMLQELAQRHAWPDSPAYELVNAEGPSHAPVYTVRVRVADGRDAIASGSTKRAAEAHAAQALLERLTRDGVA